ncbi:ABC transporter permease [Cryptosporangium phraense]|uniref:ABC transporter permease n=1 Tax=Cryptosporangium phraense TaxID=2593070 RepID=A0A545AGZ8_9ACTN|nr:ABC transporter permease [Cryptosporangium phraense]TQS40584.1 ABC transporter permease [Cryptosporangium phraense]
MRRHEDDPGIDDRDGGTLTLPGSYEEPPPDYDFRVADQDTPTEMLGGNTPPYGVPVFEPPVADRPPRDRLWPHLVWEIVLVAACVTEVLLILAQDDKAFANGADSALMLWVATAILLGSGAALSLRAGMPNIAIGAIAIGAGADYAWLVSEGRPFGTALAMALAGGALAGLVIALFSTVFGVPSWAVSLGVAGLLSGLVPALAGSASRSAGSVTPDVHASAGWWLAGAAALSVLGGLALAVPRFRGFVGRSRPTGDPARRVGFVASIAAALALAGSGALAAGAGLLDTANRGSSAAGYTGMAELAMIGFSVALLGGVSAHGRRGGVFGVVLAAALLGLVRLHLDLLGAHAWVGAVISGGTILLGLAVTRGMERFGRR